MPSTLSITIANDTPQPNGNAAVMSKTNANGNPNQATWTANDGPYNVSLPAAVWSPPQGGSLNFSLSQQQTSGVYTLKSNAPTGLQGYTINGIEGDIPPKVLVQP